MAVDPEVQRVLNEVQEKIGETIRALGLEFIANVTEATPRDLGWAAANWWGAVNAATRRDSPLGAPDAVGVAEGEQALGVAAIASAPAAILAAIGAVAINAVRYIGKLNDGHSEQAPSAFVQNAQDDAILAVERNWSAASQAAIF